MSQQTERSFPIHTLDSAPEASRPALEWYQSNFDMVPHLAGVLAESPAVLNGYWQTQINLLQHAHLTKQEINIVETVVAHENQCQYCVAGHTAFGKNPVFGNTDEQMAAIRNEDDFEESKHNVLRDFTLQVLKKQGRVSNAEFEAFIEAGYERGHALDVVACIAAKVMSNFSNQIALTPIDDAFAPLADGLPYQEERALVTA